MASNTQIFIKRSEANTVPGSLSAGELAYSYASNTLFIGANTATGPGYLKIGGQFYTNVIDSATSSNTASALVIRDSNGDFAAGNVTAAYFIGDGSALTNIPSNLEINGDTGSNTLHILTETLTLTGGEGITSTVDGNEVTFDVDDTVFRANSGLAGAVQFVDSPVVFSGNVTFSGNTIYNNVDSLNIADPIIYLAANNYSSDSVDIGFAANYFDGTDSRHTGLFRHNSDKNYYLFDNYLPEPGDTNIIDPTDASFRLAILHAELKGNVTANNVTSDGYLAAEGNTYDGKTGYAFSVDQDTGMFSAADGEIQLRSNANINAEITDGGFKHYTNVTFDAGGAILGDTSNHSIFFGTGVQDTGSSKRISIGYQEDTQTGQSWDAIAIGSRAGTTNQSDNAIAMGNRAGNTGQGESAIAIGSGDGGDGGAGQIDQGYSAVAIGNHAGTNTQGQYGIAVGYSAGNYQQLDDAIAIGRNSGHGNQQYRAVAIGLEAGNNEQQERAVAIGAYAGNNGQQASAVAIGYQAGEGGTSGQGQYSVAIGAYAGQDHQVQNSIILNATGSTRNADEAGLYIDPIRANNAIGGNVTAYNTETKEVVYTDVKITNAGITLANGTTISDGESGFFVDSLVYDVSPLDSSNIVLYNATTGEMTYGSIGDLNPAQLANGSHTWTVSADSGALYSDQGTTLACSANSVILGINVDLANSNAGRVAIGDAAGQTSQSMDTVAIGTSAGNYNQDISAVAVGNGAGETSQSFSAVAVGRYAGNDNQGWDSVAVGRRAGRVSQGDYSVAMGWGAGVDYQGAHAVAIGDSAGGGYQSAYAVAIGDQAGNTSQGWAGTSVGHHAGQYNQGLVAVAIGASAGQNTQGQAAVAIGRFAGSYQQGNRGIAIGRYAGNNNQGINSIAIGEYAGQTGQAENSIVLNASGDTLNGATSGFFVNPIAYTEVQDTTYDGLVFFNSDTKEVRYSYALDGGAF